MRFNMSNFNLRNLLQILKTLSFLLIPKESRYLHALLRLQGLSNTTVTCLYISVLSINGMKLSSKHLWSKPVGQGRRATLDHPLRPYSSAPKGSTRRVVIVFQARGGWSKQRGGWQSGERWVGLWTVKTSRIAQLTRHLPSADGVWDTQLPPSQRNRINTELQGVLAFVVATISRLTFLRTKECSWAKT